MRTETLAEQLTLTTVFVHGPLPDFTWVPLCVFMTPSSQRLESPAKPGRFTHHPLPSVERDAVDPLANGILRREEEGLDCEHSQTSEQNPTTRLHSLVQRISLLPIHDKPGPRSPR